MSDDAKVPARHDEAAPDAPEWSEELIRRIAMDVGKEVVAHIEHAYPTVCDAVAWNSARLSIRNSTFNALMAAIQAAKVGRTEEQLLRRDNRRREMRRMRRAGGRKW